MLDSTNIREPKTEGKPVETLKSMADNAADLSQDSRIMGERCRLYYDNFDNGQLTSGEKAILNKRRQPISTKNRIRRKIDGMVGLEMKGRVDPRALPRTPKDEEGADLATKALVFVDDQTRFDTKRSAMFYNLAIEGYGGVEVVVKQNADGSVDPEILRIRWEEIFYDPHSRELDFSDATYMGFDKWMNMETAIESVRGHARGMSDEEIEGMLEQSFAPASSQGEDRPRNGIAWGEARSKRVRIATMYYKCHGVWYHAVFCGGGAFSNGPSPWLDKDKKPDNAMKLQSCYIDGDNRRYGVVMDMISTQDGINKRSSKLLHQVNSRQTMGHSGAVADVAKMKRELAAPDGHVEYEQDPTTTVPGFQIIQQADQIAGQFQLLQEDKSEIDAFGPNASLIGQMEGKQSGRAILAQQQAGMAELSPLYDALRDWTLRVYRAVWDRIKQFWTEPRWIRITDEDDAAQFIGINIPAMDEYGQMVMQNQIAEIDVDIMIDLAPEMASLQGEEFQALVDAAQAGLPIEPEDLIEASSLKSKRKILTRMKEQREKGAPMQEAQQEMMMRGGAAKVAESEAKAKKTGAEAQQIEIETTVGAYRAASMGEL